MTNPFVIASHRLPVQMEQGRIAPSSGGLVSALKSSGVLEHCQWYGSLGNTNGRDPLCNDQSKDEHQNLITVCLSSAFYSDFYDGYCNQVIWPGFHGRLDLVRKKQKFWQAYQLANHKFAEKIVIRSDNQSAVWVQDYHLMLLPSILKDYQPHRKVGFFLHIPWPPLKEAKKIPHLDEVVKALSRADAIAFHTEEYRRNFIDYRESLEETKSTILSKRLDKITHVIPIGIDASRFESNERVASVDSISPQVKTIVGVDRFDYSKDIPFKFRLYEEFLRSHPEWHGKVVMKQLLVPSRENIPAYKAYQQEVLALTESLNRKFGTEDWNPLFVEVGRMDVEALKSFYQHGDVCLVTSCRDGMNLVSMEYLAAQSYKDPGVVVVSDESGSSHYLPEVFSYATLNKGDALGKLEKALTLSLSNRREFWMENMDWIHNHSAQDWAMKNLELVDVRPDLTEDDKSQGNFVEATASSELLLSS